jgi:hypothetical protein
VDRDERLNRIEEKLDRIVEKLQETNITLAENTKSLVIHEKRTDIAEQKLALFETKFTEQTLHDQVVLDEIEKKLMPIYSHVIVVNVLVKYVVPGVTGILTLLFKFGILKY